MSTRLMVGQSTIFLSVALGRQGLATRGFQPENQSDLYPRAREPVRDGEVTAVPSRGFQIDTSPAPHNALRSAHLLAVIVE